MSIPAFKDLDHDQMSNIWMYRYALQSDSKYVKAIAKVFESAKLKFTDNNKDEVANGISEARFLFEQW